MPVSLSLGNAQYTVLAGTGTTTLNPGSPAGPQNLLAAGAFYGLAVVAVGTSYVADVYDIIPPSGVGSNTATTTNKLMNGTATAIGQQISAGPAQLGVRYRGALVVIQSGTAGQLNALWD